MNDQKLAIGEKTVKYLLYLPNDFKGGAGQWPFMLFLHGRGESSGPLSLVKKWGPPRLLDHGESFPYIIASPQCPAKESWAQPGQQEVTLEYRDTNPEPGTSYYYARVEQEDGQLAWASPIWIVR